MTEAELPAREGNMLIWPDGRKLQIEPLGYVPQADVARLVGSLVAALARAEELENETSTLRTEGEVRGTADEWREQFEAVALALKCLPSSFPDANGHVAEKVQKLLTRVEDLKVEDLKVEVARLNRLKAAEDGRLAAEIAKLEEAMQVNESPLYPAVLLGLRAMQSESAATGEPFLGRWTMTHNAKTGAKIWYDGRPMFAVIAGLEDSRVSNEEPDPRWWRAAVEVVRRMNWAAGEAPWPGRATAVSCIHRLTPEGLWKIASHEQRTALLEAPLKAVAALETDNETLRDHNRNLNEELTRQLEEFARLDLKASEQVAALEERLAGLQAENQKLAAQEVGIGAALRLNATLQAENERLKADNAVLSARLARLNALLAGEEPPAELRLFCYNKPGGITNNAWRWFREQLGALP